MRLSRIAAAFLLTLGTSFGSVPTPVLAQGLPDHATFTRILEGVADPPLVDYERLASNRLALDRYIASLGRTPLSMLEAQPNADQIAFWINAYNACMLKVVLDHYPIRSDGVGLFGRVRNWFAGYPSNSVWQIENVFGRAHCPVAGSLRYQDEIEHEILRPTFNEPRIHFAVNCAARSCPVLRPEAYVGERLDEQLDGAVRDLISTPEHFRIEPGTPASLVLNKVFDWYRDDFGGLDGLKRFFADYVGPSDREVLLRPDTEVHFFEYDWTLNDQPR